MSDICSNCFSETVNEQGICGVCGFDCRKNQEAHPLALPTGSILYGRYIVGKVLGQGGFGITYLAQDYQTKDLVAIKEFFPDTMATRTGRTTVTPFTGDRSEHFFYGKNTFLNEAKTMAEFIGQKNIVQVYSYFEENNTGYFVMEYVEGRNLQEHVKGNYGRISWEEALRVIVPVMDALSAMHDKGIIHRDVTPDNIYIKKDGSVKLLDFGAARHSLGNVSRSLDVVLKHGFAPKEQYHRHGRQGSYTDVYSVAATIYYAITGTRPDDAIERLDEDNLPLPSTLGAKITIAQEDVLLKGLAIKAEDRYQTMAQFRAALLAATPVKPEPVAVPEPVVVPVVQDTEEVTSVETVPVRDEVKTEMPIHETADIPEKTVMPELQSEPEKPEEKEPETDIQPEKPAAPVPIPVTAAVEETPERPLEKIVIGAAAVATEMPPKQAQKVVTPPAAQPKKKKIGLIAAICAGVLVCAGVGFWLLHPHSYGEWEVLKAATCTAEGEQMRKCFCGDTQTRVLTKLDHTVVMDPVVDASCVETGLTEGCHCSACGAVLVEQLATPMIDHDIVKLDAVPASCEENGLTEGRGCSVCGYAEVPQEVVEALGHTPVKDAAVDSTCTQEGMTEGSHCSVCGKVLVAQQTTSKASHTPVTDKAVAATCTSTGKTEGSHCSVCGTVIKAQQTISKTSHTPVTDKAVAATCTEAGKTEGSHCSVCGTVIKAQTTTGSALGHSFSENECVRCDLKEWYAVVTSSKSTYSLNEHVTITIKIYSNNPNASSINAYLLLYAVNDNGETGSSQGNTVTVTNGYTETIDGGYSSTPVKATYSVYTTDGYYLGGCTVTIG